MRVISLHQDTQIPIVYAILFFVFFLVVEPQLVRM